MAVCNVLQTWQFSPVRPDETVYHLNRKVSLYFCVKRSRGIALKLSIKYAAGTDHIFDMHYILNQQPSTRQAQSQARPSAGLTHAAEGQFCNAATFACNTSIVFVYFF